MISKDDFVYVFDLKSIDSVYPRQNKREEMRRWCNENTTGGFRLRWSQDTGRLSVMFRDINAAFFFKLRYSNDVISESRPPVRHEPEPA
jgi:hypothetical protein